MVIVWIMVILFFVIKNELDKIDLANEVIRRLVMITFYTFLLSISFSLCLWLFQKKLMNLMELIQVNKQRFQIITKG